MDQAEQLLLKYAKKKKKERKIFLADCRHRCLLWLMADLLYVLMWHCTLLRKKSKYFPELRCHNNHINQASCSTISTLQVSFKGSMV